MLRVEVAVLRATLLRDARDRQIMLSVTMQHTQYSQVLQR